jgi:hypothetical protein
MSMHKRQRPFGEDELEMILTLLAVVGGCAGIFFLLLLVM